ncbi:MAG: hypothetical protein Q7W30_10335 [Coriobacteriia bacterium]|nr:hypothetical protein [Coriobacteriia bacterium]
MDCREARNVWSALHDGEEVPAEMTAAAEAHCPSCPECTAFRAALGRLDAFPAPSAPDGLRERVMADFDEAAAAMVAADSDRAAQTDGESVGTEVPTVPVDPRTIVAPALKEQTWAPSWFDRRTLWTLTGSIAAAAAVVSGIALYSSGALGLLGQPAAVDTSRQPTLAAGTGAAESAALSAPAPDATASSKGFTPTAPAYITYGGRAYTPGPVLDAAASVLTTIGSTTVLRSAGTGLVTATVFKAALTDGSIAVSAEGVLRQYAPVSRTLNGATYQLVTASRFDVPGQWPALPTGLAAPLTAEGTPTFTKWGTDEAGLDVFVRPGSQPTAGFALAPGAPATDPAAGNPNWTWWAPLIRP